MEARQPQGTRQQLQALTGAETQRLPITAPHTPTGGETIEGLFLWIPRLGRLGVRGWQKPLASPSTESWPRGAPVREVKAQAGSPSSFPRTPPCSLASDPPNAPLGSPPSQLLGTALVLGEKSLNASVPHYMTSFCLLAPSLP